MKFGLFTMPKSLLVSEPEIITKGVIAYQRALPPQSNSLPKRPNAQESLRTATAMLEVEMQQGSLIRSGRKRGPDVWQFRWGDKGPFGKRIYRRRVIGTVCQYADVESARKSVAGLLAEINGNGLKHSALRMAISEVCDHFIQRELTNDNLWRSYATKRGYKAYLKRWIVPHWGCMRLSEVRTMEVESWLRRLPLAKSSCAKIRSILSVLFNHACRHELFDRNPIRLVRQSAKRRNTPCVLTPPEIKALIDNLGLRERTLVLVVASTGLRQSELFGLKWEISILLKGQ